MAIISRETVLIDRRQPTLRWSAVFAGGACSVAIWLLLELLGVGAGLYVRHAADSPGGMHAAGVATRIWSLVAQVIAMFFGGMVAGKFAQTYERKLAGLHGLVMWALTSLVGMWATIWVITMLTAGVRRGGYMGVVEISAEDTGKALLILGCALLVSLLTAVSGAMAALRRPDRPAGDGGRVVRTTEPYPPPTEPAVTTAPPYPTPMTGPATPVLPDGSVPR